MFTRKIHSLPTKRKSKIMHSKQNRSLTNHFVQDAIYFVQFKTKDELNIKSKTFTFYTTSQQSAYNIHYYYYNDNKCERYFVTNAKYIGIVINRKFYVVNLRNNTFPKKVKTIFNKINHKDIEYLINTIYSDSNKHIIFDFETWKRSEYIDNIEKQITNFEFISPPKCINNLDLRMAKKTLSYFNEKLNCTGYKFDICFVNDMKNNTEISMFSMNVNGLCLCMFHNESCISSITFYKNNEHPNNIDISSFTKPVDNYADNNLNKLLRALAIVIAKDLYPDIKNLASIAINPVSAYILIKYLNGKIILDKDYGRFIYGNLDLSLGSDYGSGGGNSSSNGSSSSSSSSDSSSDEEYANEINKIHKNKALTYQDISKFYNTVSDDVTIGVKINEKNINNAKKVCLNIIENLCDVLKLTYHTASEDPYYTASEKKSMTS